MATNVKSEKNADRTAFCEMLETPAAPTLLAAALLFSLSALCVPFADNLYISLGYCLLTAIFYYVYSRSFLALMGLGVPALFLFSAAGSPMLAAVFLSLTVGASAGALLLVHRHDPKRDWYLFFLPALLYGAAALITHDPVRGLLTLLPLAIAAVMALCLLRFAEQTDAVIAVAVTLGVSLIAAALVTLAATGNFYGNLLVRLGDTVHAYVTQLFSSARAIYTEAGLPLSITDESIENSAAMIVNLMPGLYGAGCAVVGYLAWRTFLRFLVASGTLPRVPIRLAALRVSLTAAVIFAVSYLAALFSNSDHATPAGVVLQNVAMVLEPGLALVGFASLITRGGRSCLSILLVFGLLFVLWSNPATGLALAAYYGAFQVFMLRFFPPNEEKGEP